MKGSLARRSESRPAGKVCVCGGGGGGCPWRSRHILYMLSTCADMSLCALGKTCTSAHRKKRPTPPRKVLLLIRVTPLSRPLMKITSCRLVFAPTVVCMQTQVLATLLVLEPPPPTSLSPLPPFLPATVTGYANILVASKHFKLTRTCFQFPASDPAFDREFTKIIECQIAPNASASVPLLTDESLNCSYQLLRPQCKRGECLRHSCVQPSGCKPAHNRAFLSST